MKKVQIQDFMDYRYLGSLQVSPDQQHAVFTVITADREEDKYPGNLWLLDLQTKQTRQLTSAMKKKKRFGGTTIRLFSPAAVIRN